MLIRAHLFSQFSVVQFVRSVFSLLNVDNDLSLVTIFTGSVITVLHKQYTVEGGVIISMKLINFIVGT